MILTDEERERIARPFVRTIGGDHWYSGDDGIRDDGDIEKFAAAIERAVAAAVAKRCAQICDHDTRGSGDCADAIRREFGEVSK